MQLSLGKNVFEKSLNNKNGTIVFVFIIFLWLSPPPPDFVECKVLP